MQHKLKIEPSYYEAVLDGDKTFEIRYNDRGYQKGDTIILGVWENGSYNTKYPRLGCVITYVTGYAQKENWVVFGITNVEQL